MNMNMKQIYVSMVIVVMTTLVASSADGRQAWTTPGYPGENLTRKMFTLSRNGGTIRCFPPSYSLSPPLSTSTPSVMEKPYNEATVVPPRLTTTYPRPRTTYPWPRTTHRWPPRPTTSYPWPRTTHRWPPRPTTTYPWPRTTHRWPPRPTTSYPWPRTTYPWPSPTPSSRGVSVCLRFLTDNYQSSNFPLFTLSPSTSPLQVDMSVSGVFRLSFDSWGYNTIFLKPTVRFWSNMWPNMWNSICITVDPQKNVAQLFSGSLMSIRKLIPGQYMWSGEPVVDISGFDGQVTDLQVWDYPIQYKEIYSYMQSYGSQGSVLTWSRIGYRLRGRVLLEDTYELLGKQPISRRGRRQKDKKRFFFRKGRKTQEI